jgi:predicted DNA-binding protein (UPF0251 family)
MVQNGTEKPLTAKKRTAAELLAFDELSDEETARRVGISRRTLARWKELPSVQSIIADAARVASEAIRAEGITNKQNRLQIYRERHAQFEQIRRERAEDAARPESKLHGIPGATTGWIVAQLKLVKHIGQDDGGGQRIWMEEQWEFAVDSGLSRELTTLEK